MASPAAAAPGAMAVGHALTPAAPAAPPLSLAINEEAIAGMGVVDLQHALTEVRLGGGWALRQRPLGSLHCLLGLLLSRMLNILSGLPRR